MLHTTCPSTAAALVTVHRRRRFARQFGTFSQRTIDRRYSGLPFIPGPQWFAQAVRAAGGRPSALCWQPAPVAAPSAAYCHFCAGPIDAASRCACFGPAHV